MKSDKITTYVGKYCTHVLWVQPVSPCLSAVTKMILQISTTMYSAMVFISENKEKLSSLLYIILVDFLTARARQYFKAV